MDTEQGPGFTILTSHVNALVKPVHDRKHVVIPASDIATLGVLFEPYPEALMHTVMVSQRVNNGRNKDASCQNSI